MVETMSQFKAAIKKSSEIAKQSQRLPTGWSLKHDANGYVKYSCPIADAHTQAYNDTLALYRHLSSVHSISKIDLQAVKVAFKKAPKAAKQIKPKKRRETSEAS